MNYPETTASPRRLAKAAREKKRRRRRVITVVVIAILTPLLLGVTTAAIFGDFGSKIANVLGIKNGVDDYDGTGAGKAQITVRSGDTGIDIASHLVEAGVIKTAAAFTSYVIENHPKAVFDIGTYKLKKKMSAKAAYAALMDPVNKIQLRVTIPEGLTSQGAFKILAKQTGISVENFENAALDKQKLGIPDRFPGVEGFLFPATYEFTVDDSAEAILKKMVDRMFEALKTHGVSEEKYFEVLTMASIVQREAGSNLDDYPKVARVFYNRIAQGMKLQSDATVAYGTGRLDTVWTTPEERADKTNLYNTYALPGLPLGPIGLPGDVAIRAALEPAVGDWIYFMPINLETGETRFETTLEGHEKNVKLLAQWCKAHREAGGKRCD